MEIITDIEDVPPLQRTVVTLGVFDGVHRAHAEIFQKVKELADEIDGKSVVVTFEPHPMKITTEDRFGVDFFLINDYKEKAKRIAQYNIDYLVVLKFDGDMAEMTYPEFTEEILVNKLKVHTFVMGYNHSLGRNREGNYENMLVLSKQYNFEVLLFPQIIHDRYDVSSTTIRHAILAGEIELANDLLGYNFVLSGELDNQRFIPNNRDKIIPAYGTYRCILTNEEYQEEVVCEVNKKIKINTILPEDFEDDCFLEFLAKLDE